MEMAIHTFVKKQPEQELPATPSTVGDPTVVIARFIVAENL